MRFAERELPGAASKPLDEAIGQIAEAIEIVIGGFLAILDAEVSDDLADVLTPLRPTCSWAASWPPCTAGPPATSCARPPPTSPACSPRSCG